MKNVVIGDNLALKIANFLNWQYLKVEERVFNDGEILPRLEKEEKINQAILVFNKKENENINSYLIKFILLSYKLKEISSKLIGIMPYLPYSRQDAVFLEGEPLSSVYISNLIEKNLDVFITCNLHEHRKKINQLFSIPSYNLSLFKDLSSYFSDFDYKKTVVVAPDREAKNYVDDFCLNFPAQKYIFLKQRDAKTGEISFLENNFDFSSKEVIIVDDIVSSGKTLLEVAKKVKEKGALSISFAFVHLIDKSGYENLKKLDCKRIITTNTIENPFYNLDISLPLANFLKEKIL